MTSTALAPPPAGAEALGQVIVWAAPVALTAFVLALLPQVTLANTLAPSANDLGDGFGAP